MDIVSKNLYMFYNTYIYRIGLLESVDGCTSSLVAV